MIHKINLLQLLDACSSNCGKNFHLEIASRDFESELKKLLVINSQREQFKIVENLKCLVKKWAEGDFKDDAELNLIPTLYMKLQNEGFVFTSPSEAVKKRFFLLKNKRKENNFSELIFNFFCYIAEKTFLCGDSSSCIQRGAGIT